MSEQHDLEPYQPKEPARTVAKSEVVQATSGRRSPEPTPSAAPPAPARRMNGCVMAMLVMLMTFAFLCILVGVLAVLGVNTVGTTTTNLLDSLNDLLGGDDPPEVTINQIVLGFQKQAWLETVRVPIVYENQAADSVKLGGVLSLPTDRSLRYHAVVTVTAGVDLRLLDEDDFVLEGDTMIITLPQSQIKDCILDEMNSYTYDRNWYCDVNPCADLVELLRREALIASANSDITDVEGQNIMDAAIVNAQDTMTELAQSFGYTKVELRESSEVIPLWAEDATCPH